MPVRAITARETALVILSIMIYVEVETKEERYEDYVNEFLRAEKKVCIRKRIRHNVWEHHSVEVN